MSSKIIDRKFQEIKFEIQESFQVKPVITPFSVFFMRRERYIYTGEERIPFKERHPLYKVILLNEFRASKD